MTKRVTALLWKPRLLVLLIAMVAFAARVYRLGAQSVWLDEGLSILFAHGEFPGLVQRLITDDIHPPFYIVTLHFWLQLVGETEFAVRFLSAFFGVLLVPLMYRLATDLFGSRAEDKATGSAVGVIASLLVALSPFLVYYSQEARNYIVVTVWTVLSVLALWRALTRQERRWWVVYAVSSALVVYTHYYGVFVLLAQGAYLLLTWSQQHGRWRPWFASAVVAVVLYVPWLAGFWGQAMNLWLHPDYWPGTLDLMTVVLRTFASFSFGSTSVLEGGGQFLVVFGVLFAAGSFTLLARGGVRTRRGELYLLVYTVVPLLAIYTISSRYPKFAERYLIMITPAFYLVLARGLAAFYELGRWLAPHWPSLGAVAMAICVAGTAAAGGLSAGTTWQVYYGADWAKDDHRGAISYIEANSQPGDVILLTRNTYQSFEYYYHGDLPWYGFDPAGPNDVPDPAGVAERLTSLVSGHQRVWLLLWQENVVDPTRLVAGLLRKYGHQVPLDVTFTGVGLELYEIPPTVVLKAEPMTKLAALYENGLALSGYDLLTPRVEYGKTMDLSLYWQTRRSLTEDVGLTISLKDDRGLIWASEGHRLSGHYLPPERWPTGRTVRGDCPVAIPVGVPPGHYSIELNVHYGDSLRELSRVKESGQPIGTRLVLGEVEVLPGTMSAPPALAELGGQTALDTTFVREGGSPAMQLLGASGTPSELGQGAEEPLSLFWASGPAGRADYDVVLELAGGEAREVTRAPVAAEYGTSLWREGERLRGQYRVLVPPDLQPGEYDLMVGLVSKATGERLRTSDGATRALVAKVQVTGLPRVTTAPQVANRQDTRFGDLASLYGFQVTTGAGGLKGLHVGDSIEVKLEWQVTGTTSTNYKVFVHLADANGRPYGQHDGIPAVGARPTTGWVPGEYVEDTHELAVGADTPPGQYRLLVGLYGPEGKRVPVLSSDGQEAGDSAALSGIVVEVTP